MNYKFGDNCIGNGGFLQKILPMGDSPRIVPSVLSKTIVVAGLAHILM